MGVKGAHLSSHIADANPIHQGQDGTIELSKKARNRSCAFLAGIFPSAHVTPMMQPIFTLSYAILLNGGKIFLQAVLHVVVTKVGSSAQLMNQGCASLENVF